MLEMIHAFHGGIKSPGNLGRERISRLAEPPTPRSTRPGRDLNILPTGGTTPEADGRGLREEGIEVPLAEPFTAEIPAVRRRRR